MKEIKKEKTTTQTYYEYEAIDGTLFTNKADCLEYEDTARCVLCAKIRKLIVTKEHNSWDLMGGNDDNSVVGLKFKNDSDINAFLQYYCLIHTYLSKVEHREELDKLYDKCHDVMINNDILLVGINCDEEYYIINSRNNIIENLKNIDKNEIEES